MSKISLPTVLISAIVAAIVAAGITYWLVGSGMLQSTNEVRNSAFVKQAMLDEPEMMEDVFTALQEKRQRDQAATSLKAVQDNAQALYDDKRDPALGPKDAKFTIVEFFDYNCTYCKHAAPWMQKTLQQHPDDVRVIFKDFPVLEGRAEGSLEASLAAQGVWQQGPETFEKFHFAMMKATGGFDDQRIDEIAKAAGVELDQMHAYMKAHRKDSLAYFGDTASLATKLEITGTPAFVADGILVHGANTEYLAQLMNNKMAEK